MQNGDSFGCSAMPGWIRLRASLGGCAHCASSFQTIHSTAAPALTQALQLVPTILQPPLRQAACFQSCLRSCTATQQLQHRTQKHAMQVVLGVLGCPNLPAAPLGDEASSATSAEHAGEPGVGCLFAAVRGGGAFVAPLSGDQLCAVLSRNLSSCSVFAHVL